MTGARFGTYMYTENFYIAFLLKANAKFQYDSQNMQPEMLICVAVSK